MTQTEPVEALQEDGKVSALRNSNCAPLPHFESANEASALSRDWRSGGQTQTLGISDPECKRLFAYGIRSKTLTLHGLRTRIDREESLFTDHVFCDQAPH